MGRAFTKSRKERASTLGLELLFVNLGSFVKGKHTKFCKSSLVR